MSVKRPVPFVLISSDHGTLIINRNDYNYQGNNGYGVGYQLLNNSNYDPNDINFVLNLLKLRRKIYGDNVIALDCGANIGVHTVEWARLMYEWGKVISFEAQEKIYYALAGNIAINNCLNVTAHLVAVGNSCGYIKIPVPNYLMPSSFGSLELKQRQNSEFIGQKISYNDIEMQSVRLLTIDSLELTRVDFIKIDVEGMELEVLEGASQTISKTRPILMIEIIKVDRRLVEENLNKLGYIIYSMGINILAVHIEDSINNNLKFVDRSLILTF